MESKFVDVKLLVDVKEDVMTAHLSFNNETSHNIFLEKQTIYFGNRVLNNYFIVNDENNQEIDYSGVMRKRIISPDDFLSIGSGEEIKTSVVLSDHYDVEKGKKYTVKYYAYNPGYLKEQKMIKMESNTVEVVY